ncbi:hypothetical protein O6H91_16G056400 [Diphasiastrum complanatum]|uniref:Uncharacterized protein n=1 Tax=Diphasiastrum complanatum TaxID=34168 RepID=A0ACC2BCH7_DIPCM|nr:hypothetical protein O6H91_16G056400 [Diphasiastrum complanatum]
MLPAKKNFASEFARSYGFQRAKERAQSSRPNSSPDHRLPANGTSKNIEVLYGNTKALHPTDSPSSLAKDEGTSSEKSIENLNISFMEKHFNTATIWDQEFPSMCSYVSDYDPSKSPGFLSEIVLETPRLDLESLNEGSEADSRNFSDPDSCCIERPLVHLGLNELSNQNDEKIHDTNLLQEPNATDYRKTDKPEKRRRGRNNLSISASIPSDVQGVIADSIAVVKVSSNPYDDFRESMMEMIVGNNLSLLDVEELLYCYFCLNSPEHYDLIRESFFDACNQLLSYNGSL